MNIHLRLSNLLKHGSFVVRLQKRGRCVEGGIGAEEEGMGEGGFARKEELVRRKDFMQRKGFVKEELAHEEESVLKTELARRKF